MKTLKVLFSLAIVCTAFSVVGCFGDGDTTPAETPAAETDDTADAAAEGSGDKPAEGSGDK
ncbi:MAG: hypothetical protein AAFX06_26110 [Planctomycetota bacterium]